MCVCEKSKKQTKRGQSRPGGTTFPLTPSWYVIVCEKSKKQNRKEAKADLFSFALLSFEYDWCSVYYVSLWGATKLPRGSQTP